MWNKLFSEDKKDEMGLYLTQEMCMGFRPQIQKELIKSFAEPFFEKIANLVEKKAKSVSYYYYMCLQPNLTASKEEIERFEKFLAEIEVRTEKSETGERLSKWVKESIQDLQVKQAARTLSERWE